MQHLLLAIAPRNSMATPKFQPQMAIVIVEPSITLYLLLPPYLSFHSSHVSGGYFKTVSSADPCKNNWRWPSSQQALCWM